MRKISTQSQIKISERDCNEILTEMFPHLILPLVRKRIIAREHLKDTRLLWELVVKNVRTAAKEMQFSIGIEKGFVNQSIKFWKHGEHLMAIVFYAVAVEQYLNQMFQLLLIAQGWKKSNVTCLLREVNLEAKISWMFESFAKQSFPPRLGQRLRAVFSVRNAIVHFKGEPGHPDYGDDSHSKIENQLKGLRPMNISRDFQLLNDIFTNALLRIDPDRELVFEAADAINKLRKSKK